MPFTYQPLSRHPRETKLVVVIEPSGSRLEIPPLSQTDAEEVCVWLNTICVVHTENEEINYDV
jgi:hypothetical protein